MHIACYFILFTMVCCGNTYAFDNINSIDIKLIEKLMHQNELLTNRVEKLEAQVDLLRHDRNKTDVSQVRGKRQVQHVAFSAFPTNEVLNLGESQVVQFQNVVLNEGNGYNQYTSVFTAPRSGVYLLSFFVEDYHDHQSIFHLLVNTKILASGIAEPIPAGENVQGGNLVFTRLNAGDAVWVSATVGANVEGYGLLRTSSDNTSLCKRLSEILDDYETNGGGARNEKMKTLL